MSFARLLTLDAVTARLASRSPVDPPAREAPRRAAVAAVLRFDRGRPEVLLMKRAAAANDRWSGQVSFPGGREDEGDPSLLATAIRETREEVGLDLSEQGRLLGRLDAIPAVARGNVLPMSITLFVFHRERDAPVVLNHEAESSFWLPLDLAAAGELDDHYDYRQGDASARLPCWRFERYVVWGLTFQMLGTLLELVCGADTGTG